MDIGKLLFGRALRLAVLRWVADQGGAFYQGEAAAGVAYGQAAVSSELERLVELAMLQRMDRPLGNGRQYYQRLDSPLWEIVPIVDRAISDLTADRRGGRSVGD